MREAGELVSFCHEETAEAVDGRAVGADWAITSRTKASAGQPGPTVGVEPGLLGRHSVDSANRCRLAVPARRVSFALDLLAAAEAMGRGRRLAGGMACPAGGSR
jgi:hypothetical protein